MLHDLVHIVWLREVSQDGLNQLLEDILRLSALATTRFRRAQQN